MKRVVARDSQIVGTYDDETLRALLNGGTLKLADQYWDAATSTWRPLTDFLGHAAPPRKVVHPALQFSLLLAVAIYGALIMWWSLRSPAQPAKPVPEEIVAPPSDSPAPPQANPASSSKIAKSTKVAARAGDGFVVIE